MHIVSNTTSVSTFCHFSFTTTEGECKGSGSCSKAKWNLATSNIFTSDVHENTNFNLTIDLFWYPVFHFGCVPFVIKVNFDLFCTSVRLCIISHATPMFFGPWVNLWLCVDAGGGGGRRLRDRSILQRWQFCFRGGDIQFSNKHFNFLFLSHLKEVPGVVEPFGMLWPLYKGPDYMKQAIQCK